MSLLSDYIFQVQELVHDSSGIDYTTAELTNYINEARQRCSLDFACVRTYFQNLSGVVGQEAYPMYGGVGGARVTAGGSYSVPPTVTFGAPPLGGVQATGTAVLAAGALPQPVAQIAMTNWGLGYTSTPTVTIGSGAATATAVALLNVFDISTISFLYPPGGTGLTRTMLQWAPFSKFNAFYRTNTIIGAGPPGIWTSIYEQNQFYLFRIPDQNYVLEIDAMVLPTPLVNTTDVDTQVIPPVNELVQYQAAYKALLKAQNFDQASYYDQKYEKRALQMGLTRYAPRRPNIYQTNWRRLQRGY